MKTFEDILVKITMGEKGKFYVRQDIRIIAALTLFPFLRSLLFLPFYLSFILAGHF